MAEETEISTPVESVEDTSAIVEPADDADTLAAEPDTTEATAETETEDSEGGEQPPAQAQETLYAGKYKTVEDLVKGYGEAQKLVAKASEYEKKYNDLVEKQQEEAQRLAQEQLKQAQMRGFNSVEQEKIADAVQVAELEYYANNLNLIDPQNMEVVRNCLSQYYQTGHPAYLNEAKKYFPSDFVEKTAIEKSKYEAKLLNDYDIQRKQADDEANQKLAETLKADYAEFLADINENEGKALALKSFCDVGSINSKEDMQIFLEIYSKIAEYERNQVLKEIEAKKAIDETKLKAVIESSGRTGGALSSLKESYTAQEIGAMSQEEYNSLCDKYGENEITKRIK